jgi:serpin B
MPAPNPTSCPTTTAVADAGAPPPMARGSLAPLVASSVPKPSLDAAVAANNAFSVALYAQLAHPGNVITSPLSAAVALTMVYAGAQGQTATEMATALHLGTDPTSIFDGQSALLQELASRPQTFAGMFNPRQCAAEPDVLQIVNSVWGQHTYNWEPLYLNVLARDYDTGVTFADFVAEPDGERTRINAWVSRETANTINDLLAPGSIDINTRLVVVNAIHLKFAWSIPFDTHMTSSGSFTRSDGSTASAPFMHLQTFFGVAEDGQATTVELPLRGDQLSILLTLPPPGVELAAYETGLSTRSQALRVPTSSKQLSVSVPRVTFTSPTFSLKPALQAMGMAQLFDSKAAELTGMCALPPDRRRLYVDDVAQKAMVEMKETGVEAAAATAVTLTTIQLAPPSISFDRPYLISIVDGPTGAVLFLGHVEDPTDSGSP